MAHRTESAFEHFKANCSHPKIVKEQRDYYITEAQKVNHNAFCKVTRFEVKFPRGNLMCFGLPLRKYANLASFGLG